MQRAAFVQGVIEGFNRGFEDALAQSSNAATQLADSNSKVPIAQAIQSRTYPTHFPQPTSYYVEKVNKLYEDSAQTDPPANLLLCLAQYRWVERARACGSVRP